MMNDSSNYRPGILDLVLFFVTVLSVSYYVIFKAAGSAWSFRVVIPVLAFSLGSAVMASAWRKGSVRFPIEGLFIGLWLLWSLASANVFHSWDYRGVAVPRVFYMPIGCFAGFLAFTGAFARFSTRVVMGGFAAGGLVLAGVTAFFGEARRSMILHEQVRLGETTLGNPNELAYLALFGIFGAAYFLFARVSRRSRLLALLLMGALSVVIVLSGSRKVFVGELLFLSGIVSLRYLTTLFKRPGSMAALAAILLAGWLGLDYTIEHTLMGKRLQDAYAQELEAHSFEERLSGRGGHYIQAMGLFKERPVTGIGLGNFRLYERSGKMSHSEYISLFVETGIPGALLYFLAYFTVFRRLGRAAARRKGSSDMWEARFFQLVLVTILVIGIGRWNYDHPATYIMLAVAGQRGVLLAREVGTRVSCSRSGERAGGMR